jgi:hypothetical protein
MKADVSLKCGKKGHAWHKCWTTSLVTAKVTATSRGSKRKRSSDDGEASIDAIPESKKGTVATVAGPVVPKSEGSRSSSSLFEINKDSDPEVY